MTSSGAKSTLWLIGDSDIQRWSTEWLPSYDGNVVVKGYSGATLQEVVSHAMEHITPCDDDGNNSNSTCPSNTLILCAGENDIGRGCSLDETLESLNGLFRWKNREQPTLRVVLLGPKLEPWLTDDPASRKKYVKMSKAMERACRNQEAVFVDCLTMFCEQESAEQPGAVWGGRAHADPQYFDPDQLHLNSAGYAVWKRVVDEILGKSMN